MERTGVLGQLTIPISCDKCGSALTDVDYDKTGRLVSRCTNRFGGIERFTPPAS
jgi:hypothetical protein